MAPAAATATATATAAAAAASLPRPRSPGKPSARAAGAGGGTTPRSARAATGGAEALERLLGSGSSPPGARSGRTSPAPASTAASAPHRKSLGGASSEGKIERPDGKPIGRRSPSGGLKHAKVDPARQSTRER